MLLTLGRHVESFICSVFSCNVVSVLLYGNGYLLADALYLLNFLWVLLLVDTLFLFKGFHSVVSFHMVFSFVLT